MKHHKFVLSGLLVLLLFLLVGTTVLASGTWYVDGVHGGDSNNCKSPQTACKTIGHAISLASSGDTISVAAATYYENLTINMSLTIHGDFATSAPTIIDGGGVNTVVNIPNAGSNVALSNLTIRNGYNSYAGGGINNNGTLTLNNSAISGNRASAQYSFGGGMENSGTVTISNCSISGNSATDGGGIDNHTGTMMITKSSISGNSAYGGGGIENSGTLKVRYSTLSGNSANLGFGGGAILNTGTLTMTNSTVKGNSATFGNGGGIYTGGALTLTNSTVSGNSAEWGGGIENNYSSPLTISNSTLSGNSATGVGGGIANAGTVLLSNSTISGNAAPQAGGIENDAGTATLQSTIVANNPSGGNCYVGGGSINSNGYNLSSDGTCPFNNTGDLNNTDPNLGPLQNNGGPTWTQALLTGSQAIDAGNPNGCTDGNGKLLKTDQRGQPRPDTEDLGVGCDMGAYEEQKGP